MPLGVKLDCVNIKLDSVVISIFLKVIFTNTDINTSKITALVNVDGCCVECDHICGQGLLRLINRRLNAHTHSKVYQGPHSGKVTFICRSAPPNIYCHWTFIEGVTLHDSISSRMRISISRSLISAHPPQLIVVHVPPGAFSLFFIYALLEKVAEEETPRRIVSTWHIAGASSLSACYLHARRRRHADDTKEKCFLFLSHSHTLANRRQKFNMSPCHSYNDGIWLVSIFIQKCCAPLPKPVASPPFYWLLVVLYTYLNLIICTPCV